MFFYEIFLCRSVMLKVNVYAGQLNVIFNYLNNFSNGKYVTLQLAKQLPKCYITISFIQSSF